MTRTNLFLVIALLGVVFICAGCAIPQNVQKNTPNNIQPMAQTKKILLVVASEDFQPLEYQIPKNILTKAGVEVVTASDADGTAISATGDRAEVDVVLEDVKVADYDGIFFIGGPGALEHLDNEKSYKIIREAATGGKPFGAICISPRILTAAGVLKNKKATGWDGDNELAGILEAAGAEYIRQPVVVDGALITANGPPAAEEFAKKILENIGY